MLCSSKAVGTDRVTAYQAMPSTAFIQGLNQVTIQKVHRPQTTAAPSGHSRSSSRRRNNRRPRRDDEAKAG